MATETTAQLATFHQRETDDRIVAFPYNGILFDNKKEVLLIYVMNTNECQRHNAQHKKPDAKECVLSDSVHRRL